MTRRIVLEHATGTLAGVCQILGTYDQIAPMYDPKNVPTSLNLVRQGTPLTAVLVKSTPREVRYRELPLNPHIIHDQTPEGVPYVAVDSTD